MKGNSQKHRIKKLKKNLNMQKLIKKSEIAQEGII